MIFRAESKQIFPYGNFWTENKTIEPNITDREYL